jgi:hypothetical protein
MAAVLIGVLIVAVLAGGVLLWTRSRRRPDGVDSFRRQIDALSPDSRRPTIDRMKPSEPPSDDEDGAHGA